MFIRVKAIKITILYYTFVYLYHCHTPKIHTQLRSSCLSLHHLLTKHDDNNCNKHLGDEKEKKPLGPLDKYHNAIIYLCMIYVINDGVSADMPVLFYVTVLF